MDSIIKQLQNVKNQGNRTCKIFAYSVFRMLLAPTSSTQIDLRLGKFIEDLDIFVELNLTKFIVDYLEMGINHLCHKILGTLVGSPHLLAVSTLLTSK
jgi:hypothetical protein